MSRLARRRLDYRHCISFLFRARNGSKSHFGVSTIEKLHLSDSFPLRETPISCSFVNYRTSALQVSEIHWLERVHSLPSDSSSLSMKRNFLALTFDFVDPNFEKLKISASAAGPGIVFSTWSRFVLRKTSQTSRSFVFLFHDQAPLPSVRLTIDEPL